MGTNFYVRRIPTQEEVAALHKHVDVLYLTENGPAKTV